MNSNGALKSFSWRGTGCHFQTKNFCNIHHQNRQNLCFWFAAAKPRIYASYMQNLTAQMPWSGHFKATLALGLPMVGSHLAQMSVNLTDTLMLGWYGVNELAAVVLAGSAFFLVFIVGSGFALAIMPMVANAEGENDIVQVRRVVRMGFWITVIFCTFAMPAMWQMEAFLLAIGQKAHVAVLAQDYMRIAQWAMFPAMLVMVLKSYLSALERPQWVLWATLAGTVINALLNYALIFGNWGAPELGVKGAAIASLMTATVTFIVLFAYANFNPALKKYDLFVRIWRSDWPAFWAVFRLGWPIGAALLAETGLFSATAVMMGWIGTVELATHGIVLQIAAMTFMIYLGLSNVGTVRAGRALGRKDGVGLRRAAWVVIASMMLVSICVVAMFLSIPEHLIALFLSRSDPAAPAIIAFGISLMVVAAAFQVADGLQVVLLGLLRGLKDTAVPMVLAVISYWIIGLPAGYLLGFTFGYGGVGVWVGLVVGLSLAALTLGGRLWYVLPNPQALAGQLPSS